MLCDHKVLTSDSLFVENVSIPTGIAIFCRQCATVACYVMKSNKLQVIGDYNVNIIKR